MRRRRTGPHPILTLCAVVALALVVSACASMPQDRSAGQVVDDATIHAKVETALSELDEVDVNQVDVEVRRGIVTLSRLAETSRERRMAGRVVGGASRVRGVDNELRGAG